MRRLIWSSMTFLAFCIVAQEVVADGGYRCVIRSVSVIGDDGLPTNHGRTTLLVGQEIVIDKKTGRMTGAISNYKSGIYQHTAYENPDAKVRVEFSGEAEGGVQFPFKAVSYAESEGETFTGSWLQVESRVDGPDKPFLFVADRLTTYSGLCRDI